MVYVQPKGIFPEDALTKLILGGHFPELRETENGTVNTHILVAYVAFTAVPDTAGHAHLKRR